MLFLLEGILGKEHLKSDLHSLISNSLLFISLPPILMWSMNFFPLTGIESFDASLMLVNTKDLAETVNGTVVLAIEPTTGVILSPTVRKMSTLRRRH